MKRITKLIGRKCFGKWTKTAMLLFVLSSTVVILLLRTHNSVVPKAYVYFGGWEKSDICNKTKTSQAYFVTLHDRNINLNLFIHNPEKDTISRNLYRSALLTDIPSAKLVKAFFEVYTDIDYVIDIGAHVGTLTILSALMGKRVVSIDGEEENLKLMCSSISYSRLHKKIVMIHEIAGLSHNPVTWVHSTNGNYSGNYIDTDDITLTHESGMSNWKTEGRSPIMVDNLLEILPNITTSNVFMHIDVNGYENMVLLGAHLFMKRTQVRGILINFKYHKKKSSGLDIVQIVKKIGLHPYQFVDNTLINLEKQKIREWPDQIMWL